MSKVEFENKPQLHLVAEEDYVCSLTIEAEQRAITELGENPKERLGCVQALREWIDEQPHIIMKTDAITLLSFLRTCKFSQLRVRRMVDSYLTALSLFRDWFYKTDIFDPGIQAVVNSGFNIPLPKLDKNGCQILLYRMGRINLSKLEWTIVDEIKAGVIWGAFLDRQENTQVNGCVVIFDCTGVTLKHILRMNGAEMKKWNKAWQGNFPGRFRAVHVYNAGTLAETGMTLFKPFLNRKYQEKIHVHSTAASLCDAVGMEYLPEEYLPDDYKGSCQGSCDDILEGFKQNVLTEDLRQFVMYMTGDDMVIDESKRKGIPLQESFRKLSDTD